MNTDDSNNKKNLCDSCVKNDLCYFTCKQKQYDGIVTSCNHYEKFDCVFKKIRNKLNDSSDVIQFFAILFLYTIALTVILYLMFKYHCIK